MFHHRLTGCADRIQAQFDTVLGALQQVAVVHAMAHATRGGKRLRGFLVMEGARLHEIGPDRAIWPATGIEALHAGLLRALDLIPEAEIAGMAFGTERLVRPENVFNRNG